MIAEALCGRKIRVPQPPESTEELCLECDKDKCMIYIIYHYAVTHQDNK